MADTLHVALLAGEASGDTLGAGLMQGLLAQHNDIIFTGIGGPKMESLGLKSMVPMERLSVMGLIEPLKRLPELLRIRKNLYEALVDNPPDVFIGIDSPDFNLGLEVKLRQASIPTVHYVSPSVWAWRQGRIRKIKKAVDLMLTLFPFENKFYQQHDVPVQCVGHPLADEFEMQPDSESARQKLGLSGQGKILAVLPGSRGGEVSRLAPVFLETARRCKELWPDTDIVIPCANKERMVQIQAIQQRDFRNLALTLTEGDSRTVMSAADCILMASGTASLEGMLLKKPMVVAYKMAPISYAIISRMLKAPYVSLPNLLAGKEIVPELLQDAVTPDSLFENVKQLMDSEDNRQEVIDTWNSIHQSLQRDANKTAAAAVLDLCQR